MVKKKGQKSAQSKKKLDLAAAVEAAEQGNEEDLSQLNLNSDEGSVATSADQTENGSENDGETATGNDEGESAVLVNYNPPEESVDKGDTGKVSKKENSDLFHVTPVTGFLFRFNIFAIVSHNPFLQISNIESCPCSVSQ